MSNIGKNRRKSSLFHRNNCKYTTAKVREKPAETGFFGISLDISQRNVYYNYKLITKQIQRNYTAIRLTNKRVGRKTGYALLSKQKVESVPDYCHHGSGSGDVCTCGNQSNG